LKKSLYKPTDRLPELLGSRFGDSFQGSLPTADGRKAVLVAVTRFGVLSNQSADGFSSPKSSLPLMGLTRSSENVLDRVSDLIGFFAPSSALACAGP
jgi:hypothetical protein